MLNRRLGRLLLLWCAAALLAAMAAQAEDQAAPPAGDQPPAPAAEAAMPAAQDVYDVVKCLQVAQRLYLTKPEIEQILPLVQKVADQAAADKAADAAAYQEVAAASKVVLDAFVKGETSPAAETAALDAAARAHNAREAARARLTDQTVLAIGVVLTHDQRTLIESPGGQAARKALMVRLEGAATPLDYVLQKLQEQLELMPDEYLRTREQRALDMAHALLGGEGPRANRVAATLLRIMDQIAQLTPEQYAKLQPDLPSQVAKALGLLPPGPASRIFYDDFLDWIAAERTPAVLKSLLAGLTAAEGAKP